MINIHIRIALITLLSISAFASCTSPSQKVEDAKENVIQAQKDYATEIENFKKESNDKISAQEKAIANLKAQIKTAKKDVKTTYEKNLAVLEQKTVRMKKAINEYKVDGKDKWQEFKNEFSHDMDELSKSLKDFTIDNK